MKNVALIIAGGAGKRTGYNIPKQFVCINNKPIVIYTMEVFQKHPSFDDICVVCLKDWEDVLLAYANQYNITKLKWITQSGETGQQSIFNGIIELRQHYDEGDAIFVHDAVRPLLTNDILNNLIATFDKYGSGIVAIPCTEAVFKSEDGINSDVSVPRELLYRTQTPQVYTLGKLLWAHNKAKLRGITNSVSTSTLMSELGETIYLSPGEERNMKVTNESDFNMIAALMNMSMVNSAR